MYSKYVIITVIGSHAGEDISTIFTRKQKEIKETGGSYWLIKSFRAKTSQIQELAKKAKSESGEVDCLFIESSQKNGAKPTLHSTLVKNFSHNSVDWELIPKGIKVTGKVDKNSTAIILGNIEILDKPLTLDMWDYAEFGSGEPVKLQLGASTICCERHKTSGMKSRFRNVVAIGKVKSPYAVWVQ